MIDEICDSAFLANFDTAESPHEKVGVEVLSAELAVRDGLQSNFFLPGNDLSDSRVFSRPQLLG
jgi:hypothetical protein